MASLGFPSSVARAADLVKWRARRRQREEGAILFVVAMTMVVLASLGVYALKAASTEIRTSGYVRQTLQTQYLAEYGILGAAHEVQASKAQLYLQLMMDPAKRDTQCQSLPSVPSTASNISQACRRVYASELGASWRGVGAATARSPLDSWDPSSSSTIKKPGSLGAIPLEGDFVVEVTEPSQVGMPPGFDQKLGLCFAQFTITSTGRVFPQTSDTNGYDAPYWPERAKDPGKTENAPKSPSAVYAAQSLLSARARITAGPVACPK